MHTNAGTLLKNTLLLSVSSIAIRFIGLLFQIYLAKNVGAEGLGIFGLISSAYTIFVTVSISGMRFSLTRLVAEEEGLGNPYPKRLVSTGLFYALSFGLISFFLLFNLSSFIAQKWICTDYARLPLKILSFSLPFISISAVFDGYFSAKQKILRLVILQLLDQLLRIGTTVFCFSKVRGAINHPCDVLSLSSLCGEVFCALAVLWLYTLEARKKTDKAPHNKNIPRLLKTAMPLAISAYMRTGLSSLGHIIIPYGLRRSGMGGSGAFITYGIIHQMSFPVLLFPIAVLSAFGEILVPRITKAQVEGQKHEISHISNRALRLALIFSFAICGFMFFFGYYLGEAFYKSAEAGLYIRLLAPLIPVIYCDCVTDGCLKGLGQQLHSMILNVLEALLNVLLLLFLLPRIAIVGYILTVYIKESFNTFFSLRRLSRVTKLDSQFFTIIALLSAAAGSFVITTFVFKEPVLQAVFYFVFYSALIYIINDSSRNDIKWLISLVRGSTARRTANDCDCL
ncbi:MAG: oligosaccharide flippase family protein [Clostridia bacterium]|nr:oligosaccharide flippase family protein [Clostridia bacterium]